MKMGLLGSLCICLPKATVLPVRIQVDEKDGLRKRTLTGNFGRQMCGGLSTAPSIAWTLAARWSVAIVFGWSELKS